MKTDAELHADMIDIVSKATVRAERAEAEVARLEALFQATHNVHHSWVAEVTRLREALEVIATCPPEAVHLMPLAAQAALSGTATTSGPNKP